MLNQLLSWIVGDEIEYKATHSMLTQEELGLIKACAIAKKRELISESRISRLSHSSIQTNRDLSALIKFQDEYLSFIEFYIVNLGIKPQICPFIIACKYLQEVYKIDETYPLREGKVTHIFSLLLSVNKEEALAYYHDNLLKFKEYKQIKLMVDADKVATYLSEFKDKLAFEAHPRRISPLFNQFIDDTEKFTAAILWLLHRGVSTRKILQSNLLQNFMAYHVAWLQTPESPIHHLYNLLSCFDEASRLVEAASKVRSDIRGFYSEDEDGHSYSLTGMLCEDSELNSCAIVERALDFTPNLENFEYLLKVFGFNFLNRAIIWHTSCQNEVWHSALTNCLNSEIIIAKQLPVILNRFGVGGESLHLATIALLVTDATIDKLIINNSPAVLHLLPFKPMLRNKIGEAQVLRYLHDIKDIEGNHWESVTQLISMLIAFSDDKKDLALLVYNGLIDLIFIHPELLDDRYLMTKLKKFSEANEIINFRVQKLQDDFERHIKSKVSEGPIDIDAYHQLEDIWLDFSRQFNVLNSILPIPSRFPSDKYKMHAYLAKFYADACDGPFDLNSFFKALDVSFNLSLDGINECDRILIEILLATEKPALRDLIIDKFEENAEKKLIWLNALYGDDYLINRAIKQGNLGLIKLLISRVDLNVDSINKAIEMAMHASQWVVINYFLKNNKDLSRDLLKKLLPIAATAGQLDTIIILTAGVIPNLKKKHIEEALIKAAVNGHHKIVKYLCDLDSIAPSNSVLAKALTIAIKNDHIALINTIGNLPESEQLISIIERSLISAVANEKSEIVKLLCSFSTNSPRSVVVEDAFILAIKCGLVSLAQYLSSLSTLVVKEKLAENALKVAIENGQFRSVTYLCNSASISIRQETIEKELDHSVKYKHIEIVKYLCIFLKDGRQRSRAIEIALRSAVKAGYLPCVEFLSTLVDVKVIEKMLNLTVTHGQIDIAKHFCSFSLSREAISFAMRKAKSVGKEVLEEYFRELLSVKVRRDSEVDDVELVVDESIASSSPLIEPVLFNKTPPRTLLNRSATPPPPYIVGEIRRAESLGNGTSRGQVSRFYEKSSSSSVFGRLGLFKDVRNIDLLEEVSASNSSIACP